MIKANHITMTCFLSGILLLAGCRGTVGDLPEKDDVTFSLLGTDTRTTIDLGEGKHSLRSGGITRSDTSSSCDLCS